MLPNNTFNKIRELFVTESFQNSLRVSVSPVFPFFFFSEKTKNKKKENFYQIQRSFPNPYYLYSISPSTFFPQPAKIVRLKTIRPAALLENVRQPNIFRKNNGVYFILGSIV